MLYFSYIADVIAVWLYGDAEIYFPVWNNSSDCYQSFWAIYIFMRKLKDCTFVRFNWLLRGEKGYWVFKPWKIVKLDSNFDFLHRDI